MNFYLRARRWPTEFVLDHEYKVATFRDADCPSVALPKRCSKPYLWEDFILRLADGRIFLQGTCHGSLESNRARIAPVSMSAVAAIFLAEAPAHRLAYALGVIRTESSNGAKAAFRRSVQLVVSFFVHRHFRGILCKPGPCCLLQYGRKRRVTQARGAL